MNPNDKMNPKECDAAQTTGSTMEMGSVMVPEMANLYK
jgi:hypothetical protein